MQKLKDENYYVVHAWMLNKLALNGNELLVFAVIYGFSQDENGWFSGSVNYLSQWLGGASKSTVVRTINSLVSKGYIIKEHPEVNGVGANRYAVNFDVITSVKMKQVSKLDGCQNETGTGVKMKQDPCQNETGTGVKMKPYKDIYIDKSKDKSKDDIAGDAKKQKTPYEKITEIYNTTCESLPSVKLISDKRKSAIRSMWRELNGDMNVFLQLFSMAEESDFLTGRDGKWSNGASFDWLMNKNNAIKVLEGNYKNKGFVNQKGKNNVIAAQEELARRLGENGNNESTADDSVWGVW